MKKHLLALLLVAFALPALADEGTKKTETVKSIYQLYFTDGGDGFMEKPEYFTSDFRAVLKEDESNTPDGEMGCIDYDPIISGQDWDAKALKRTLKLKVLPSGNVEASFRSFGQLTKVQYVMQCGPQKCLIDDVLVQFPDERKFSSFKKTTRQCMAEN